MVRPSKKPTEPNPTDLDTGAQSPQPTPLSSSPTSLNTPLVEAPKAEPARKYKTDINSPDRPGEEAEREFAEYGGDVPNDRVLIRRITRRNTRAMSGASSNSAFPDLHLVDSAFNAAHRERSRAYSIIRDPVSGQEIVVAEDVVDENKVQWLENDVENPQNWSVRYKWLVTALCGFITINVTFASSAPSSATLAIAAQFNTSEELALAVTSLFLMGYVVGPLLWAPLSEIAGRRIIFVLTMFAYMVFQLPEALATNIESVLVGRFLSGVFASAPLTNCGGVIADIWDPIGRGPAMSVFSASVFIGPVIGPIIGGFVTESYLGWRWVFWVMMIFGALSLFLIVAFLPETYAPILLAWRAKKMRKLDPVKNADVYAELERADFSFSSIATRTLARPFIMLYQEPILWLVTIYLSVIYGLLYALFSVFPIIWGTFRGFNSGEVGLVFIGVGLGTTLGAFLNVYLQRHYVWLVPKWHGHPPPEERLYGAMMAGPFLIFGIFMLGWTGQFAAVPWYVPAIATIFVGMSFTLVFISFLSYIIECYLMYSASALSANTVVRSAVGAAFPLFTNQMFAVLGIGGACSLIGGIAILIAPSPYFFFYYGSRIRKRSNFSPNLDIPMKERVLREEAEEKAEKDRLEGKVVEEKPAPESNAV